MTETMRKSLDRLDRFNARDLTATEVADTFVRPNAYASLLDPSNALLMGPRGSGKTTLMKMLTYEGLERQALAETTSPTPYFAGVYVPIDVQLSDRLDGFAQSGLDSDVTDAILRTVYGLHVFRCVVDALSWHCKSSRRHSETMLLPVNAEAEAVDELSELWGVRPTVPTATALRHALRARQGRALVTFDRQVFRIRAGKSVQTADFDLVDLDNGLKGAADILGSVTSWPGSERWAILFDEVEVAPDSLQRHVLSYLRYSDTHVLFKVAIAPYMQAYRGIPDRSRGSALNDFKVVDLQAADEGIMEKFTRDYFAKATALIGLPDVTIDSALGGSVLSGSKGRSAMESYGHEALQARSMAELATKDPSFAAFLDDAGLTPDNLLGERSSNERAPFRKARQVALVRNEFLSDPSRSGRRIKSRTSHGWLYTGAPTVIRLCEGNPRRLAFMTGMLIQGMSTDGTISDDVQVKAIFRTEAAFRSFLRGVPVSPHLGGLLPRGLLSLLDLLGHFFHGSIVVERFNEDPICSFIVDSTAGSEIEELIARGVNSGALVQLADSTAESGQKAEANFDPLASARGKRFRLSYLLAPGYGLLVRSGRANSLRSILDRSTASRISKDRQTAQALLAEQNSLW